MAALNMAAYGEGVMYPPNLASNMSEIQTAGWTSVILGLFHVDGVGDINFNDTQIISGGSYVGDSGWPGELSQLLSGQGSTIKTLLASFGGSGVADFQNIQNIYQSNNNSFAGTPLESSFQTLYSTFYPTISLIDMDVEDNYDEPSFAAFCQMLAKIGFGITFCPYATLEMNFWTGSLAALNTSNPGAVKWWNLQCYDGGGSNDPSSWAAAISKAIPGFDTNGFILGSDWVLNSDGSGDCPQGVYSQLSNFNGEACVGGAFLWTIDDILWQGSQTPNPCGGSATMADYVTVIAKALG